MKKEKRDKTHVMKLKWPQKRGRILQGDWPEYIPLPECEEFDANNLDKCALKKKSLVVVEQADKDLSEYEIWKDYLIAQSQGDDGVKDII